MKQIYSASKPERQRLSNSIRIGDGDGESNEESGEKWDEGGAMESEVIDEEGHEKVKVTRRVRVIRRVRAMRRGRENGRMAGGTGASTPSCVTMECFHLAVGKKKEKTK